MAPLAVHLSCHAGRKTGESACYFTGDWYLLFALFTFVVMTGFIAAITADRAGRIEKRLKGGDR